MAEEGWVRREAGEPQVGPSAARGSRGLPVSPERAAPRGLPGPPVPPQSQPRTRPEPDRELPPIAGRASGRTIRNGVARRRSAWRRRNHRTRAAGPVDRSRVHLYGFRVRTLGRGPRHHQDARNRHVSGWVPPVARRGPGGQSLGRASWLPVRLDCPTGVHGADAAARDWPTPGRIVGDQRSGGQGETRGDYRPLTPGRPDQVAVASNAIGLGRQATSPTVLE
jgi:hypothetical protein